VSKRLRFVVATYLLLLPFAGVAQENADLLEPMDIFHVQVASDPRISPEGKRIVYVRQSADISSDRRVSNLWIVNVDGSEHRPVTTGTYGDSSPRWSPDGTRIAFVSGREGKSQVEELWYESSLDKRRIEGWIIKPPDFDPAKKYPLILQIHGGPFSNYGDRFDLQAQIWAAKGYVILYTNPRGSTSHGEEFANLIHHSYPGDDFYDLNSGVDAMLAKGYIDKDNLFVTGGSGGGVLTCWMIDRTDRFRAAASLYPVINWYSWVLTSDLPSFGAQYWFGANPWDDTDNYMKRSVISLVKT
jgi:dipeptidyl aminopeptidase/acylaminoacyl peptidase